MTSSTYFLGVDGGGTKTQAVIIDDSGQIRSKVVSNGSNLHNVSQATAIENIQQAISQAIEAVKTDTPIHIRAAVLGLAGLDTPTDFIAIEPELKFVPADLTYLCNDGLIGLKSGTDKDFGVCLIASTGSNCYGLSQAGDIHTAGDWGYLLGDQGSAFAFGLKLIQFVIKEYDGRKPHSLLSQKVLDQLQIAAVPDLMDWAYRGVVPVKAIASLSHLGADPKLVANPDIKLIAEASVEELTQAYATVISQLQFTQGEPFPVVLVGGLFKLENLIQNPLRDKIHAITPEAEIVRPDHSPAVEAARLASRQSNQFEKPSKLLFQCVLPHQN